MRTGASWAKMERLAFTAWLAASATGCTSWQTVNVSPEQLIAEQHPKQLRVTSQDGSRMEIQGPSTSGDTLLGTIRTTVTGRHPTGQGQYTTSTRTVAGEQAQILFSDVTRIETRHVSEGKTIGLVVGILAVVVGALVAYGIALNNMF